MPKDFDRCVEDGGRVKTLKLSGGRYRRICYIKGKSYLGHIKRKKK